MEMNQVVFPVIAMLMMLLTTVKALWDHDLMLAFTAFNGSIAWMLFIRSEL